MPFDGGIDTAIANQLERFLFLQYFTEVGAVLSASLTGMLAARGKRMDLVGTYILAFTNAFGGGTLRDVLLNRRPLFWVEYPQYPVVVFVLAVLFVYSPRPRMPSHPLGTWLFNSIDALGLALFSLTGVSYALGYGMPYFVASLIGVITGVFGGVLRDVLLCEIPFIFRTQTSLYATCSFIGCWVFLLGLYWQINPTTASSMGFLTIVLMRVLSIQFHITLPTPRYLKTPSRDDPRQ